MGRKGTRKYACVDCGKTILLHWVELARRGKPVCPMCGGRSFEPASDGARERETQAGTARAILEHEPPQMPTNLRAAMMRGERDVPAAQQGDSHVRHD